MSTVRIQVRRGSSSDWTSVNPVLAAGEIGFETNTKKMKVGDGSSTWSSLDYISSDAPAISEISQDAINSALTMGDGISKVYDDAGNTITLENTGVLSFNTRTGSITLTDSDINTALGYTAADAADVSALGSQTASDIADSISTSMNYADNLILQEVQDRNSAISQSSNSVRSDSETYTDNAINALNTSFIEEGGSNLYFTMDRAVQAINERLGDGLSYDSNANLFLNTGVVSFNVNSNNLKVDANSGHITAALSDSVLISEDLSVGGDLTVSGNLNINGTTTSVNSVSLSISDNLVYLNQPTTSNIVSATHTQNTVTYNIDSIGSISENQTVVVTGVTPSSYNISRSDNISVQSISGNSFTVNKTVSENYTSGGVAEVYASVEPDLGIVGAYDSSNNIHKHSGLFRDASNDGAWTFFDGYTPEPGIYIDKTDPSFELGNLVLNNLHAVSIMSDESIIADITGNAASSNTSQHALTADKLSDLVKINNVSFDGSADIVVKAVNPNSLLNGFGINSLNYDGTDSTDISIDTSVIIDTSSTQTLNNKTLILPKFSSISNTGTLTLPTSTDVLVGRITEDTLENKTINAVSNTLLNIPNSSISNPYISINGSQIELGGSVTGLATQSYANSAIATAKSEAEGYTDSAISTEVTNRNSAIATAKSEAEGYTDSAISTEVTNRNSAIATAKSEAEGYTDSAISTEVTNRNSAIATAKSEAISTSEGYTDSAISTEVTNRNSAIATAKSEAISTSEGYTDTAITNLHVGGTSSGNVVSIDGTQTLTNKTLTTPTIASFTNSTHNHTNSAGGGTLTSSAISDFTEASQDAVNSALTAGTGISKVYDDANNTITVTNTGVTSISGTTNQITASASTGGVTLSLPSSVTMPGDLIITGSLTVNGTTETVNTTNLAVSDPLIYMATGNSANASDIGIVGHFDNGTYQHTGLVRDHADGKWKLFSGITTEPSSSTINLTGATYDTLKAGTFEGNLTGNVTGNVTGTVSGNAGTVTNGVYTTDTGTVTNTMLAGSIANAKLSNSAVTVGTTSISLGASSTTLAGLTSVTSTGFTGALTGNASTATKLAATKNINGVAFDGSADITITAANPNALTIGTGLSGTSYTGSGAVTIAIDSTVATLTGTQTLTNKTLTSPSMTSPTVSSGTLTVSSNGITFSDATVQTSAGVPSITTIATAVSANNTTYYPSLDRDKMVPISGTYTLTIAPDGTNTAAIGTSVDFYQSSGTGAAFAAGAGVTILSTPGLKLRTTGSVATIMKTAANTWLLFGDLSA